MDKPVRRSRESGQAKWFERQTPRRSPATGEMETIAVVEPELGKETGEKEADKKECEGFVEQSSLTADLDIGNVIAGNRGKKAVPRGPATPLVAELVGRCVAETAAVERFRGTSGKHAVDWPEISRGEFSLKLHLEILIAIIVAGVLHTHSEHTVAAVC